MPDAADQEYDDDLIASVVTHSTAMPNMSAGIAERFSSEVMKLLETRAQDKWQNENDVTNVAVFVHVEFPRVPYSNCPADLSPILDLPVSPEPVFGKLFFLSNNADNGSMMPLPCDPNSILDWLENAGLSDRPVLIAYGKTQKVSFRPAASGEKVERQDIRDEPPNLTIKSLHDALKSFHQNTLVTPTMSDGTIWEPQRSADYIPAPNTEKAIQRLLKVALQHWFRGIAKVETEDKVPKGRIDVRILMPSTNGHGLTYWSIIELKVARSFQNAPKGKVAKKAPRSKLISEIAKGFGQANEFTADREVKEGFLEIYDMRKDKSDDILNDSKVKTAAEACTVKVNCNLRPMYGSSEEARSAE